MRDPAGPGPQLDTSDPRSAGRVSRRALLLGSAAGAGLALIPEVAQAAGSHRLLVGMQDATGAAARHTGYGSLRLWDVGTSWADIETAPGAYDWTTLDHLVAVATLRGVEVTHVVGGHIPEFYGPVPDPETFRVYATALMARYGRRIKTYSTWNEVNDPRFWPGTPEQMTALCQVLAEVRDAVVPGARLLSPSFQTSILFQRRQLEAFLAQSHATYDAVGVSLYPKPGEGPEHMALLARECRTRMTAAGCPTSMPLWGTEVNYSGEDLGPHRQAAYVLRSYLLAATVGIERLHWYRWDWYDRALADTFLSHHDLTPTEAGKAVQTSIEWLHGNHARLHIEDHGTHRVVVETPRGHRVILWNPRHLVRVQRPGHPHRTVRIGQHPKRFWVST